MKRKLLVMAISLCVLIGMSACTPKEKSQANKSELEKLDKKESPRTESNLPMEKGWYDGEMPFVFDYHQDYPITDIQLSDMAKVTYVQLETREDVLLRLRGACSSNETYMTDEHIYLNEEQS